MNLWAEVPFNPIEELPIPNKMPDIVMTFVEDLMDLKIKIDKVDEECNDEAYSLELCFDDDELLAIQHNIEMLQKERKHLIHEK